jgi:hypothetical protein
MTSSAIRYALPGTMKTAFGGMMGAVGGMLIAKVTVFILKATAVLTRSSFHEVARARRGSVG